MPLTWRVKRYNGSAFVDLDPKRWNGSSFVDVNAYYYDGSSWVLMTDRSPDVQQYTTTWTAIASQTYKEDGSKRTDIPTSHCYQGYFSGTNGNQRSSIHFDSADIRAALAGSTIDDVNIYLNNEHTYLSGGGTVSVGTHNMGDSPDTTFSFVSSGLTQVHFDKGEAKWFDASNTIAAQIRDNDADGIVLRVNSNSNEYYGYYLGDGSAKIQITYTK